MSISEELARLAKLRDDGILTPAEFDHQKALLLDLPSARRPSPPPGPIPGYGSAFPPDGPPGFIPPRDDNGVLIGCLIAAGIVAVVLVSMLFLALLFA